jgi:murein DD-endopeptidase MepM/ murein hydrolase activator NlpD
LTEPTPSSTPLFPIRGEYWETSPFGLRESPFTGNTAVHYGTDYGAPEGAEIQAVKDGVVVTHWPAPDGYYKGHPVMGGYLEILHDDGLSRYAHLSKTFVHEGWSVKAGDLIGIIGNTGKTAGKTGRHLHFELLQNPARTYD